MVITEVLVRFFHTASVRRTDIVRQNLTLDLYSPSGIDADGILLGIMVNISGACSDSTTPTVLPDLGYYADWINAAVADNGTSCTVLREDEKNQPVENEAGGCCSRAYEAVKNAVKSAWGYMFGG